MIPVDSSAAAGRRARKSSSAILVTQSLLGNALFTTEKPSAPSVIPEIYCQRMSRAEVNRGSKVEGMPLLAREMDLLCFYW
ncbi:hypothetical protein L596_001276 [Steinernema carpocapsae]|uniref:Uncharacterized protein n=1 Tax=Steinernema carpocapsae TaxID=34508 RepID=A0A4U8UNA2_STECR|nr:hypothetical protein L596_001276 [Steinernema carpocapsae]